MERWWFVSVIFDSSSKHCSSFTESLIYFKHVYNNNSACTYIYKIGNAVICGRNTGVPGIQIIDLGEQHRIKWFLNALHTFRSIALEREYLLTWSVIRYSFVNVVLVGNWCKWNKTVFFFSFLLQLNSGTVANGVGIYDVCQSGGAKITPISLMKSRSCVNSLSWSSNGYHLASGCESGVVHLWDVRQPKRKVASKKSHEKNPVQVSEVFF